MRERLMRRMLLPMLSAALAAGLSPATALAQSSPVQWDANATKELEMALHHIHDVWNRGDIPALKGLIVGDPVLPSYELDPKDHKPIRLGSKQAIDAFVDRASSQQESENRVVKLEKPVVSCRATSTFGVCTEECTIHVMTAAGAERIDRLWSTNVAVRYPDGWKWIQWQQGEAGSDRSSSAPATTHTHESEPGAQPGPR